MLDIGNDGFKPHHHRSNPLFASAYESVTQENIELKSLVEILKAKNKADESKNLALKAKIQEQRVTIDENYSLISRLQKELTGANHDVTNLTAQLDHKRELFLKLQTSLQDSVNECVQLRHQLEASHLETVDIEKKKKMEIEHLEDKVTLLTTRTSNAQKKCDKAEESLREAEAGFRIRGTRRAIGLLYMSCLAAFKRIIGRSFHQWRACTTAAVAVSSLKKWHDQFSEDKDKAHAAEIDAICQSYDKENESLQKQCNASKKSQEEILHRYIGVIKEKVFGLQSNFFRSWREICMRRWLNENKRLHEATATFTEQLRSRKEALTRKDNELDSAYSSMEELRMSNRFQRGMDILIRIVARQICRREAMRRSFRNWSSKCLSARIYMLAQKEVHRMAKKAEHYEKQLRVVMGKVKDRSRQFQKLNRKLEGYRDIACSLATVMRYHAILCCCFSSWKQYSIESKIKRIGSWPELWRLSRLTPDKGKKFSDILHESEQSRSRKGNSGADKDSIILDDNKSIISSSSISSYSTPQRLMHQFLKADDTGLLSDRSSSRASHSTSNSDQSNRRRKARFDSQQHKRNEEGKNATPHQSTATTAPAAATASYKINIDSILQPKTSPTSMQYNSDFLEDAITEDIDFDDYFEAQMQGESVEESAGSRLNEHDVDTGSDRLSEAHELESSFETSRTASGGVSVSAGSLAFSGTMGSFALGNSGAFSATGDFSHAMALNPTPSQEYLHLLSPRKNAASASALRRKDIVPLEDVVEESDAMRVEKAKDKKVGQCGKSLTFDSQTLELTLSENVDESSVASMGDLRSPEKQAAGSVDVISPSSALNLFSTQNK